LESISALVAGLSGGLTAAAPGHPVQDVVSLPDRWREDEHPEKTNEFGAGQKNETGRPGRGERGRAAPASARTADATSENGDQRIQKFQQVTFLAELEGLLDPPSAADHLHQSREGDVPGDRQR
jgi:hypothetical protein